MLYSCTSLQHYLKNLKLGSPTDYPKRIGDKQFWKHASYIYAKSVNVGVCIGVQISRVPCYFAEIDSLSWQAKIISSMFCWEKIYFSLFLLLFWQKFLFYSKHRFHFLHGSSRVRKKFVSIEQVIAQSLLFCFKCQSVSLNDFLVPNGWI